MSDPVVSPPIQRPASRSRRGQSLVEFALVLPMLLVLFLGVADFGRVFAAGVIVEAIARDSAEAVSGDQRLMELKKDPTICDSSCRDSIYAALHQRAADVACEEAAQLVPTTDGGGECLNLIVVGSCIHDGDASHICGFDPTESVPDGCDSIKGTPWSSSQVGPAALRADGTTTYEQIRTVEVRVCYRFMPLYHVVSLPIVSYLVPEYIYIEKTRTFSVSMDY